jgi:hypothetical protein
MRKNLKAKFEEVTISQEELKQKCENLVSNQYEEAA